MKKTTTSFFLLSNLRAWLSMLTLACTFPLFGQSKLIEKANEHYQLNQFAEAAALYEQALVELDSSKSKRNTTNIKTKLANCYRMNNKMEKAAELYAVVVQDEKTKSDIYFFYGEALMGTGKYEEAKGWFLKYSQLEPDEPKGLLMAEACDKVPFIQPYFPYVDIQEFAHNSPADDNGPVIWADGMVFSSDREQGFKLLKEKSGWTGRDYLDLYFCKLQPDGTYSEPEKFSSKLSEINKNTGNASFAADGSEVFFTRNDNVINKQQTYNLQIYSAQSSGEERWKNVEKLPFCSPNFNFMHPAVSPDGQWLFFTTNKSGGFGGTDLWVSKRKSDGGWENPTNLGPDINTAVNEGFPFMDRQGRLYFCSKGHPGFGGFDIFFTEKDENGGWKPPVNLGKPLNSTLDDISIFIAPGQQGGMFTSSRKGGDDDIYLFKVMDYPPLEKTPVELVKNEVPATVESKLPEPELTSLIETTEQDKKVDVAVVEISNPAVLPDVEENPDEKNEGSVEKAPGKTPIDSGNKEVEVIAEEVPPTNLHEPAIAPKIEEQPTVGNLQVESSVEIENQSATIKTIEPINENSSAALNAPDHVVIALASIQDFNQSLIEGKLRPGERFRLDGATYDAAIWQLTPRISSKLDELSDYLKRFPSLELELGFHTESLGIDDENQKLSENRAAVALDYLLKDGITKNRVSTVGYGESMLLNRCGNGEECSIEDHLFNQRIEVKILAVGERQ